MRKGKYAPPASWLVVNDDEPALGEPVCTDCADEALMKNLEVEDFPNKMEVV